MIRLNEDTFLLYAAAAYTNPNCTSTDEFIEDVSRLKYIKKLLYSFKNKGILRERLILNHVVIMYNVFDSRACTKMLLYKLEEYLAEVIPFLDYLGYMPDMIDLDGKTIKTNTLPRNEQIIVALRNIGKHTDG